MDVRPAPLPAGFRLALTVLLAAAVIVYGGYHLTIATSPEDTNHLETPLALAVARQVTEGPSVLYGPFTGRRPLVLIHAPLYYRLAALGCWPLAALGIDPVTAALAAGRLVALGSFLLSLVIVARLARLDGAGPWAGWWAALLVASAPVFGSFPATVRPDTLGVMLQTLGAGLVLRALRDSTPRGLPGAYACFALAFATKQHDVFVGLLSSALLGAAWWRGRLRPGPIVVAHLLGAGVVIGYYGLEQWWTAGAMFRSVFELPAAFGKITPADWSHVATCFLEIAKRSLGLIALGGVGLVASRRLRSSSLDRVLALCLAAELVGTVLLCRGSTGAWVNYAMQAVVFAAILTARALGRLTELPRPRPYAAAALVGALILLAADTRLAGVSAAHRREERAALRALLADPRIRFEAPDGLYFVGFPQHNRMYGRAELAHDEWLYTAYEALGAAEPRQEWLRRRLTDGSVRLVVVPLIGRTTGFELPGISQTLPEMGYTPLAAVGRYRAWMRRENLQLARSASHR